jgi:alpha-1,2-mannosyltransferase
MVPVEVQSSGVRTHDRRLLMFVVVSLLLANVVQWAVCRALHLGNPGSMIPDLKEFFHVRQWTDSWLPMMKSLDYFKAHPTLPIYDAKLYDTLIYSLASELPLVAMRKMGMSDAAMLRALAVLSFLAVWGVAAVSLAMGRWLLRRRGAELTWPAVVAVVLATLGCYPLIKGYSLGNAQTFLSFGFAVMLLLWTTGRERSAGVVAALLTAVKPQFILLLVWMLVRRRWGAAWAFVVCGVVLIAISVAVFGWHNNLDYIGVLAGLSHKAQSHYANQSMFGTINRMIFNGENIGYTPYVYTPYIPWVYRVTVMTSLLLVGLVLVFPCGDGDCCGGGEPDGLGTSLRDRGGDCGVGLVCAWMLDEEAAVGVGCCGVSLHEFSAGV